MIQLKRWNALPEKLRREKAASGLYTFIPSNSHGIPTGYFQDADIVMVLRERKAEPKVVQFVLDMLE